MPKNQPESHKIQAWSLINRKYLGQGVRVKRFRRPKRSQIRNRVLLAILMAKDIKLSRLAEELSVSSRSVSAWVYEGRIPSRTNLDKVCRLLGYPSHILFNEALVRQSPIVCQPTPSRFMKRTLAGSPAAMSFLRVCAWFTISPSPMSASGSVSIPAPSANGCIRAISQPSHCRRKQRISSISRGISCSPIASCINPI